MTNNRIAQNEQRLATIRALHDADRDAIRQLQERLDVVGSILDSVRADLYIKETEQAYSDALDAKADFGTDQQPNGFAKWKPKVTFADSFVRNEAAMALIKTAYASWLNNRAELIPPSHVRHLVSAIADALTGRTDKSMYGQADLEELWNSTCEIETKTPAGEEKLTVIYDLLVDHFIDHARVGGFGSDQHLDLLVQIKGIIRR